MSDLIDRQAVIDLLKQMRKDGDMVPWEGKDVFARIRKLPTIQPEKAQLSQEGTTKGATSDLISRTETVEHLRRMLEATVPNTDYDEGFVDGVEFGVSTVSTMPTVQPQSTVGQLNDGARSTNLIDRQQVIDALKRFKPEIIPYEKARWYVEETIDTMYNRIDALPPAQPEPHEGHWIDKGWNGDWGWQIDGRGNCWRVIECSECGKGVLVESNFCPHCGAKMKGAEHEND